MKIRYNFISNSSSSSFIVIRRELLHDRIIITPTEEKMLKKYGFKKVLCFYPDQIEYELDLKLKNNEKQYNLGYYVTCNQDYVMYFLLKNNIPFKADCHYGHYSVIYEKDAKTFIEAQNFGQQLCMYGEKGLEIEKPIKKHNVKDFLQAIKSSKET